MATLQSGTAVQDSECGTTTDSTAGAEGAYYEALYRDLDWPAEDVAGRGKNPSSGRRDRKDVVPWEEYFMALAILTSQRSKDPSTQVGAVIVRGMSCTDITKLHGVKKITGIGYNDWPEGCKKPDADWEKKDVSSGRWVDSKYAYVCHAAINAILSKNAEDLTGCTLFTTLFPDHEDAKLIIQCGIKEVVYCKKRLKKYAQISQGLFSKAEIKLISFREYREGCAALRIEECEALGAEQWQKQVGCSTEEEKSYYESCVHHHESNVKVERERMKAVPENISVYPRPEAKPEDPTPREAWSRVLKHPQDYYMGIACLSARRSKDPDTQVGACIVDQDGKIVGIGYNGWPYGISDDISPRSCTWGKDGDDPAEKKNSYEANAIMHKTCIDLKGCSIYTTLFPCNECAKLIVQSGITEVYYLSMPSKPKLWATASHSLLESSGYTVTLPEGYVSADIPLSPETPPTKKARMDNTRVCTQYIPKQEMKIYWLAAVEFQ